jgi:hypothetical protein
MDRQAVKDLVYGGLSEISRNSKYYYASGVGSSYNHLTDDGRVAVGEFIEEMIRILHKTEQELLDKRAKEMVIAGLKTS